MKKVIFILIPNVVTFIIFFSIGEIYLRMKQIQPYVRTFPGQYKNIAEGTSWWQSDPYLGWISRKWPEKTNLQGFLDPKDFNSINLNSGNARVMILGDSFMWGAGPTPKESVPNLLQIKLNDKYEVFNVAIPGWGIDQMYLAYQKYKDVIRPGIVILAFIDDDVNRVLEAYRVYEGLNKPSFTINDGELVFRTSPCKSELILNKMMEKSIFLSLMIREIYLVRVARPIVKEIFLKLAQETERRKERFVVVRIPTPVSFDKAMIWHLMSFKHVFKDTGVEYLEPLGEMKEAPTWIEDFYQKDGHMSPAGVKYLVNYIYKYVFQNSVAFGEYSSFR